MSGSGLGFMPRRGTPKTFGNVYKVNEHEDPEPASHDVVMESSCGMQTVPAGRVDADVEHSRLMPTQQQPPNQRERAGMGKNPGGRIAHGSNNVTIVGSTAVCRRRERGEGGKRE